MSANSTQQGEFWENSIAIQHQIVTCATCCDYSRGDRGSPQPSWIGSRYEPGGVVFVLSNPAVAPRDWGSTRDHRYAEKLDAFRSSPNTKSYGALVSEMHDQMQGLGPTGGEKWGMWSRVVRHCVAGCLTPAQFAWGNLCKHRTPGGSAKDRPPRTVELAHGLSHLRLELGALRPRIVVAVGSVGAEVIESLSGTWELKKIRARGATIAEAHEVRDAIRSLGLCQR
ncbi:MAG: hypothetical protein EPO22_06765 [Dehalococcoidia bacterium]|nr:MAG: hypothetical protein EPO22_06765 [Dehalococcoidia bacterium]